MIKHFLQLLIVGSIFTLSALAQMDETKPKPTEDTIHLRANAKPLVWARAALKAHGGEKLLGLKSLTMIGSIEATPPNFPQPMLGSFALVRAGEKGRLQIDLGIFKFIQVYDGERLDSTLKQVTLLPLTKYGIAVLPKIEDSNYVISEDEGKKPFTFLLTSPEGILTEFRLDSKTGRVKSLTSTFYLEDTKMTTEIEYESFQEVDGLLLPKKFYQRLNFGQASAYIKYKVKEIGIDWEIDDDIFTLTGKEN